MNNNNREIDMHILLSQVIFNKNLLSLSQYIIDISRVTVRTLFSHNLKIFEKDNAQKSKTNHLMTKKSPDNQRKVKRLFG